VTVTSVADLIGAGTEVTVGGRSYTLRKPTIAEEAAFSNWIKDRAKREAAVVPAGTPPELTDRIADRQTGVVMRDVAEGYYDPPSSPGYVTAFSRPDGMAELLYLTLKTDHPNVTRESVRLLVEEGLAREWARVIELEKKSPEVVAAVLEFIGLPPTWLHSSESSSSASPTPPSTGAPGKSGD
jgi:hypothetical protein